MELEQAYRVLELKPGAGIKEAVEAREDQLALWDPERLAHHPRLRSRAAGRIETIRRAYEVVMGHIGESGHRPAEPRGGSDRAEVSVGGTSPASSPANDVGASSSLFDEVFSSKGPTRRFPTAAVVLAVLAVLVLALAFLWVGGGDPSPTPEPEPSPPSSEPAPPPGAVEAVPDGGNPSAGDVPAEPSPSPAARAATFNPAPARLPPRRPDAPKLVRRTGTAAESRGDRAMGPSGRPPKEGEWIYRRLLSGSPTARRLAEGGFGDWRFQGWEIVQAKPPEYWVDLSALPKTGPLAHFIWSVNLSDGAVAAWNEAARQLETAP